MKKFKAYVTLLFVVLLFSSTYAQYVRNFQAVYPFNNWNNPTKNYTFTKEFNQNGYFLAAVSNVSYAPVTALAALKLDNNFNVQWTRSFMYSGCTTNSSIQTFDVTATSDGGYIACGILTNCNNYKASFIVKFTPLAVPQWMMSYPGISVLNSIVEQKNVTNDVPPVYIACGKQDNANSSQGVILKVDMNGVPVWQRNTITNGISDRIVFNQVIQTVNVISPVNAPYFAVVGNAFVTYPSQNDDVILTLIDTNGNVRYCNTYGIKNNLQETYKENGYSITMSGNSKLVISGSARKYIPTSVVGYEDVLLLEVEVLTGILNWAARYDALGNNLSEEPGRAVKVYKENIYVAGYQTGRIFNVNQSYDAFLMKMMLDGSPVEIRLFGEKGNDLFYKLEANIKGDGMVPVGFSTSYNNLQNPAPYIVESYPIIKERCYDAIFELKAVKLPLVIDKVGIVNIVAKYIKEKLVEINNPVAQKVLCKKEPIPVITPQADEKGQTFGNNGEITISPVPAVSSITINGLKSQVRYTIVNSMGMPVKTGKIANGSAIGVEGLKEGVYFIKLNGDQQKVLKFVKSNQ